MSGNQTVRCYNKGTNTRKKGIGSGGNMTLMNKINFKMHIYETIVVKSQNMCKVFYIRHYVCLQRGCMDLQKTVQNVPVCHGHVLRLPRSW